jgi:hypothetical protein
VKESKDAVSWGVVVSCVSSIIYMPKTTIGSVR